MVERIELVIMQIVFQRIFPKSDQLLGFWQPIDLGAKEVSNACEQRGKVLQKDIVADFPVDLDGHYGNKEDDVRGESLLDILNCQEEQ